MKVLGTLLVSTVLAAMSFADPQWGTFRPHALISARATVPHSPYFGFVYHPADNLDIRHLATDNHDKVKLFSWSRHDGSFGDQDLFDEDANLHITSHFLAHPLEPSACVLRVTASPLNPSKPVSPISLIFYAVAAPEDVDPSMSTTVHSDQWGSLRFDGISSDAASGTTRDVRILGNASNIGGGFRFRVNQPRFGTLSSLQEKKLEQLDGVSSRSRRRTSAERPVDDDTLNSFYISSSQATPETAWAVEEHLGELLQRRGNGEQELGPLYTLDGSVFDSARVTFVQRLLETPFELDATFVLTENRDVHQIEHLERDLSGSFLDDHLKHARDAFDRKFKQVFRLKEKGLSKEEEVFARRTLSNVLGGIGYFYGSSFSKGDPNAKGKSRHPGFLKPVELLTATPSRAVFPRGFLWDEGFHQLIIQRWDPELSQKCMKSWFAAVQKNGWIPREQVLGLEARMRFPRHVHHLMIQNPLIANPPTILIPLKILSKGINTVDESKDLDGDEKCDKESADVQRCSRTNRTKKDDMEYMLKKATRYYKWIKGSQSGLKENSFRWRGRSREERAPQGYPLTLASGLDDYPRGEVPNSQERHVDLHCWVTWASGILAELTERLGQDGSVFRTEHKKLRKYLIDLHGISDAKNRSKREDFLLCDFDGEERVCHEGYVTILPMILGLLDPTDVRLSAILDSLENPEILRAHGGLRSLSKADKWYRQGDDYWTGSIWMPFNYITLAALKTRYAVEEGPYRERAQKLYESLKKSILDNAFQVFDETGQLWENYSPDDDGKGKSGRQFTGWSALILLMYADMYDGVV